MRALWKVTPQWSGETVFIIAGGPSVLQQDLRALQGRRVIAVNSSYEAYPDADILFFGDLRWFKIHYQRPGFRAFKGIVSTINTMTAPGMQLRYLRQMKPEAVNGFCEDRTGLAGLRTNLQGAMNLAAHLGCKKIVLLGADMRRASNGRTHHHSAHPWRNLPGDKTWDIQMRELRMIAAPLAARGVEVINTSLESRIDWWPKLPLSEVIRGERRPAHKAAPAPLQPQGDRHWERTKARLRGMKLQRLSFNVMPHERA